MSECYNARKPVDNASLQLVYNSWHEKGPSSWFSDGNNERKAILESGESWHGLRVLEIGCGEGDLAFAIRKSGARYVQAIDYSEVAIAKAKAKHEEVEFRFIPDFHVLKPTIRFDRVVLQGVVEHLDKPWNELDWIIRNLVAPGGDVISSSPNFVNSRGLIWMTLATLFDAKMSLTDLHFLHPWEFENFAELNPIIESIAVSYTDESWGNGEDMIADYRQRLYKVFPDMEAWRLWKLISFLTSAKEHMTGLGATAVYKLQLGG